MPPTPKPTLVSLVGSGQLTPEQALTLENLIIRIIQIQEEIKVLEAEKGYRDPYTGTRHPGLSDQLETLLILHDLTTTGLRYSDYTIALQPGSNSRIDPDLLLAEGIDPDTINRCTTTKSWLSPVVKKNPSKRHPGTEGSE